MKVFGKDKLIINGRYMTYLSDRQLKQLLCDHLSKISTEPNIVRTEIRSQSRSKSDKDYKKTGLLARRSL